MKQLQRALARSLGSRDAPADRQLQPEKQETRASDKDFSIQCALLDKVSRYLKKKKIMLKMDVAFYKCFFNANCPYYLCTCLAS